MRSSREPDSRIDLALLAVGELDVTPWRTHPDILPFRKHVEKDASMASGRRPDATRTSRLQLSCRILAQNKNAPKFPSARWTD
jgi:hypothetical protein